MSCAFLEEKLTRAGNPKYHPHKVVFFLCTLRTIDWQKKRMQPVTNPSKRNQIDTANAVHKCVVDNNLIITNKFG